MAHFFVEDEDSEILCTCGMWPGGALEPEDRFAWFVVHRAFVESSGHPRERSINLMPRRMIIDLPPL